MKLFSACFFAVLLLGDAQAQDDSRPRAVPLFSQLEHGPAFMVECTNGSAETVSAEEFLAELALRVDGKLYERTGPLIGSFLGIDPSFSPGELWKIMVCLRQEPRKSFSAQFGANLRIPWHFPLPAGSHNIEFRCHGKWSEIEFFVETDSVAR